MTCNHLQGYPLLAAINDKILRIFEAGLVDYWTRLLIERNYALSAVSLKHIRPYFYIGLL